MTRILALDTSTWWGSAALLESAPGHGPRIVAEFGEQVSDSHAEHVLDWIERVLAQAGWSRSSLDAFAAARGPGSFTGIRVGLGTVRGLSLASGRPCAGVTTLEALAEVRGADECDRVPVMDAGRGQVYSARYDAASSPPRELDPPALVGAGEVPSLVRGGAGRLLIGPGTRLELPADASARAAFVVSGLLAGAVGRLAALRGFEPPGALAPLYVRPPDVRTPASRA